ncbi:nucleolin isoform X2 [Microcaecilia unicolor]|uniref:Nucleolin n=1 Tax=Microcaecilia unicolor TaxID=1415580 RepID=A0A6P7Z971_9AMPH|nr:nucleolin isoform X2 [Microcaecilia unicolor]
MVKLAKAAKSQTKLKKAPPPKEVEDSDEEDSEEDEDSSEAEEEDIVLPKKKTVTPAKKIATPAKTVATPAKKATTPSVKAVTPAKAAAVTGKKGAATAKNGKKVQKEASDEDEDDDDDDDDSEEESEEEKPAAKQKLKAEEEEDDDDDDDEDDDDDSEEEAMDTTPPAVKGKKTPVKPKEESEEDDEEEEEDEEEEDSDEDESEAPKASGKRKKEMPNKKSTPEAKKPKTEEVFSVFIGNLNASKDFDEIKEAIRRFFTKKNLPVVDVRIGSSKKFGYADFSSEENLTAALELTGKKVLGLEVKLERAKSKEGIKEHKKERDARTLFVKNLPYSTTADDLKEVFDNAVDVRLPLGMDGSSKGIAYVEFQTEAEADAALEAKQGTEVEGRAILLDHTGEKSQQGGGGKRESKILIVNNLSYSATEDSLQELFQKAASIRVPQNNQGRPKGFAFVEFSTLEDAKEALESHNNAEIEGRSIRLEFSQTAGPQGGGNSRGFGGGQTKTLFVRGLSDETTEETLREAFEGSVGARIAVDRDTGASKGFGFVDFSSAEEAKAAKEAMEDGEIDGNKVTLDFAKPKGDSHRGGRGGFGGKGGGRGGRGGFGRGGGGGGGRGRGGFGRGGGGGFRGGNKPQGKKIKFE